MKILFVYSTINCICTTKCCYELAKALKKYSTTKVISYKELSSNIIEKFDIIVFQRIGDGTIISKEDKGNIIKIVKENKTKKFIYLVDDLIVESQGGLPKELAAISDAVMCSSNTLCNNFMKYNKHVFRFHTFIDSNFYDSIKKNAYKKFTISWVSSGGLGIDIINEIIDKMQSINIDFNLIAIGGQSYKLKKSDRLRCYNIVSESKMIELIKGSDILLNPMTTNNRVNNIIKLVYKADINEFLNSKAEIKYLTAGMCKSCLITSKIECYAEAINNGVNGFILSDNAEEWIDLIVKLYYNKDYLNRIIENAYKDVKERYDINIIAKDLYNKLAEISKLN